MLLELSPRVVRYGAVVFAGFALDFMLTLAIFRYVGLALQLCAAVGFFSGLTFNYVLFEHWVFRHRGSAISLLRFFKTSLAASATLATRLAVITLVEQILGETFVEAAAAVSSGATASSVVNYLLIRIIFRRA